MVHIFQFVIVLYCLLLAPAIAEQQLENQEIILKAMVSSFDLPLGDLSRKKYESELLNIFDGFSGNFSIDFPLTQSEKQRTSGVDRQGVRSKNNITLQASIKYNPLSYWFINATFYYYLDSSLKASFNPDFSYSFGYDDWHPYTFSLVYSNYGGNRFNPNKRKNERFTTFEEGTISIGWKFLIPKVV